MLYLIGLGLGDAKDITVKGLEIVQKAGKVYLENYTSILCCGLEELEKFYGRSLVLADREMMEQDCEQILDDAVTEAGAAVLIVGDPLNATTHTDLILRAASRNIPYQVIHNASIVNAVACCGLQIYNFGEIVSIPFWTETWRPESFFDKIVRNQENGLHTLCLLDIKVKEPNYDLLIKGIKQNEPPRFMSVNRAAEQIIETIDRRRKEGAQEKILSPTTVCIGLARVGSSEQKIAKAPLDQLASVDLGPPLHSLVIPGVLHPLEIEMMALFSK